MEDDAQPPADGNPYAYSFDDEPPRAAPQPMSPAASAHPMPTPPSAYQPSYGRNQPEQTTLLEDIGEEIEEAIDLPGRLLGCVWWLVKLPVWLVLKIIEGIFD